MNYSPLRYPGGKSKLTSFIQLVISTMDIKDCTYIEPFAGGSGIAIGLLLKENVKNIIINDYDKAVYSFWRALIEETEDLIRLINDTPVSIEEWKKQKNIYTNDKDTYSLELGFSFFYLNRTNRSGILKAGPIGGFKQNGNYRMDARYNKENLIKRIKAIASKKSHIKVYNRESKEFITDVLPKYEKNAFVYFDPPYFNKGKELYQNFFTYQDHCELRDYITNKVNCNWIVTYDNVDEIKSLYKKYFMKNFDLNYSLANHEKGTEVIIFKNKQNCPTNKEIRKHKIKINIR